MKTRKELEAYCIKNIKDGYYPTNWVCQSDLPEGTRTLTHDELSELATFIGENDTENGTYWDSVRCWVADNIK